MFFRRATKLAILIERVEDNFGNVIFCEPSLQLCLDLTSKDEEVKAAHFLLWDSAWNVICSDEVRRDVMAYNLLCRWNAFIVLKGESCDTYNRWFFHICNPSMPKMYFERLRLASVGISVAASWVRSWRRSNRYSFLIGQPKIHEPPILIGHPNGSTFLCFWWLVWIFTWLA